MQRRHAEQIWLYDATTGAFTYRNRPGVVATRDNGEGYLLLHHGKKSFRAHRIAWLIHYGEMPDQEIDHINGVRSDNRITNLRSVSRAENMRNVRRTAANSTGVVGVYWDKDRRKWRAMIRVDRKLRHLGLFNQFEAAVAARKASEREYGFHPNHGRN